MTCGLVFKMGITLQLIIYFLERIQYEATEGC
jgi:hypothetical protein